MVNEKTRDAVTASFQNVREQLLAIRQTLLDTFGERGAKGKPAREIVTALKHLHMAEGLAEILYVQADPHAFIDKLNKGPANAS